MIIILTQDVHSLSQKIFLDRLMTQSNINPRRIKSCYLKTLESNRQRLNRAQIARCQNSFHFLHFELMSENQIAILTLIWSLNDFDSRNLETSEMENKVLIVNDRF